MNFTNIKLTQNQQLLVNAFLSMVLSALAAAAQAGYQYLTQHGFINLSQAFLVFVGVLWVAFSTALAAYIPAHAQQELEALRELKMQVNTPVQPLVVIHTTGASVQQSENVPAPVNSVPSVQIPPRPVAPSAPKPVQLQSVEPVQQPAPQQVWLTTTMRGSSGVQQDATDDVLGDLPASTGQPMNVQQITGVVPVYGASGK